MKAKKHLSVAFEQLDRAYTSSSRPTVIADWVRGMCSPIITDFGNPSVDQVYHFLPQGWVGNGDVPISDVAFMHLCGCLVYALTDPRADVGEFRDGTWRPEDGNKQSLGKSLELFWGAKWDELASQRLGPIYAAGSFDHYLWRHLDGWRFRYSPDAIKALGDFLIHVAIAHAHRGNRLICPEALMAIAWNRSAAELVALCEDAAIDLLGPMREAVSLAVENKVSPFRVLADNVPDAVSSQPWYCANRWMGVWNDDDNLIYSDTDYVEGENKALTEDDVARIDDELVRLCT